MLFRRPGQLIRRSEIQAALWPDATHVDFDGGINFYIRQLRKVLNDSATEPRFIETLPRKGYRFIARVAIPGQRRSFPRAVRFAAASALGVALGAAAPCVQDRAVRQVSAFLRHRTEKLHRPDADVTTHLKLGLNSVPAHGLTRSAARTILA